MFDVGNINIQDKICLECNREFTGIIANCPHDNSLLFTRVQDPFIGTTLAGNYEIESIIGTGGMGVVYKARHAVMDRVVAIKMLQAQLISDSMSVKRFQQESKAASRIKHRNVITIYDFGISPTGQPYIVMDYLEGESLADVLKRDGQVAVERAIKILMQSCDALEHAHQMGVIHRDLKPTNIVLSKDEDGGDFVRVVDFGVAKLINSGQEGQKLTQAGEVCGSPVYMSPEQCMGMDLDIRSDIYSMGVLIYETLTGRLPILGKTMVDTMSKHITEPPIRFKDARPDLYIPERLEAVVFKALAKDPADRHQTMAKLMVDLQVAIPRPGRSEVLRTLPSPDSYAVPKEESQPDSNKKLIPILAGLLLTALIGGGAFFFNMNKPKPAPTAVTPALAPTTSTAVTPVVTPTSPTAVVPAVTPNTTAPSANSTTPSTTTTSSASVPIQTPAPVPPRVIPKSAVVRRVATEPPRKVVAKIRKVTTETKAPSIDDQAKRWADLKSHKTPGT